MQLANHMFNYDDWCDSPMIFNAVDATNQVRLIEDITDGIVGNKSIDYTQAVEELADRLTSVYAALITDYFPKDKLDEDMEKDCERAESLVNMLLTQVAVQLTNDENGYRDEDSGLMCPLPTNDMTLSREERFKTNKDNIYENYSSNSLVMYIDGLKTPHDVINELDSRQIVWINNNIYDIANAYYEPEKAYNSARLGGIGSMGKIRKISNVPPLSWFEDTDYGGMQYYDAESDEVWCVLYDLNTTGLYGVVADASTGRHIIEVDDSGTNGSQRAVYEKLVNAYGHIASRNKTAEITWGEASDILEACVDKAVEYFEDMVSDGEDVDDAVSEAVYGAIDDTCMYFTDQLAMIWACGALDDAFIAASEKISDEVYNEFYQKIDPEDYRKEGRRKAMRKKAYNYWESMEYNGDDTVEFTDIIPINVYEGKSKYTDGGYVFSAELYTDDVTWDEYDENESYTWGVYIIEDGAYEWGNYTGVFTGTEWEAQNWADGIIQKFIDDYEAGLITPQGMDWYSQHFDLVD